jgi:hypothetical protein
MVAATVVLAVLGSAPVAAQSCTGDCDGDGAVNINELIVAVNVALGRQPLERCVAADADSSGAISISELITSVRSAIGGCQPNSVGIPLVFLGQEFQVNSFEENFQDRATIASAASGDFIVAWESFQVDGFFFGVAAQRYAATGDPLGGEFVVNTFAADQQRFPAVAVNDAGDALVAWRSDATPQDSEEQAFVTQLFAAGGAAVGAEVELTAFSGLGADVRTAASSRGDGFVVVWEEFEGAYTNILGRLIDADGMTVGDAFVVNSYTTSGQSDPAVAGRAGQGFVVVWQSRNQDGSDLGVFGQRFADDGQRLGAEFRVNSYTPGRQGTPGIAMDGSGRFYVSWIGAGGALQNGIIVQRFASDGSRLGEEFVADTPGVSRSSYPVIAADDVGEFLVVWQGQGREGPATEFGIFARQFTSAGVAVGEEFQVNTYTPNSQSFPAVTADDQGRFVVVWTSSGQDGDEGAAGGIFGQRLGAP